MRLNLFQTKRDEVDSALDELRRQGAGRTQLAHFFASLLVVLFSAGSLVALGSDALNSVLAQWETSHTLNIPSTITLAVTFLMVLAMDMALIHAAGMLRVLSARRAGYDERWVHIAVMVIVSVLESGTYAYMSFRFEHPVGLASQALITARALAAPLLAVYLSMAKQLPVTARDLLAYAELASGKGVLLDVVAASNNRTIDMSTFLSKLKLYQAAAVMIQEDRDRLAHMVNAVVESGNTTSYSTASQDGHQYDQNGTGRKLALRRQNRILATISISRQQVQEIQQRHQSELMTLKTPKAPHLPRFDWYLVSQNELPPEGRTRDGSEPNRNLEPIWSQWHGKPSLTELLQSLECREQRGWAGRQQPVG